MSLNRIVHTLPPLLAILILAGCASMATQQLAGNIASAMLNQDDPEIVMAGAPAYLLLLDGMIEDNPDDPALLMAGAKLYGAYATGLSDEPEREKRLTNRSRNYARSVFCQQEPKACEAEAGPFEEYSGIISRIGDSSLAPLYVYAASWAGWIKAHSDDWNAVADLAKVELMLQRVAELEPAYEKGRAQLYLGVIRSRLPPSLGGKPEIGRHHFELALKYSRERDLIAKVEFARSYARLVFDQALHDRLLNEVLQAEVREPELTLSNVIAKRRARELLADDYF
ncbi:MAG: TRAP transporter TatT component family protein [Candidatus Sedimenticola sp. 6PFRAG5]